MYVEWAQCGSKFCTHTKCFHGQHHHELGERIFDRVAHSHLASGKNNYRVTKAGLLLSADAALLALPACHKAARGYLLKSSRNLKVGTSKIEHFNLFIGHCLFSGFHDLWSCNVAGLLVFFVFFMFFHCLLWSLGNFLPKNPRVQVGPGRSVTCETEELLKSCGLRWAQWPSHSPILTNHLWGKFEITPTRTVPNQKPLLGLVFIGFTTWHETHVLEFVTTQMHQNVACPIGFPRNVKPILGYDRTTRIRMDHKIEVIMVLSCSFCVSCDVSCFPTCTAFYSSVFGKRKCKYVYVYYIYIYGGVCVCTYRYLFVGRASMKSVL